MLLRDACRLPEHFLPAAVALQKLLPTTDDPCGKVFFAKRTASNEYLIPARVDYNINNSHSLFVRHNYSRLDQQSQYDGKNALTLDAGASPLRVYEFVLGDTYLIGANIVNNFRGSVNRSNIVKLPPEGPVKSLQDIGVKTYLYDPPTFRVSVTNGFTMGSNNGTYSRYNTTASQLNDDISIVVGNHQIGVGGGWIAPWQRTGWPRRTCWWALLVPARPRWRWPRCPAPCGSRGW